MKFNLLDLLLPREIKFYEYLNQQAANLLDACVIFKNIMENIHTMSARDRRKGIAAIKDCERKGDDIERQVVEELNKTFITPLDREDIYSIVINVDRAMDTLNRTAKKIETYAIYEPPPNVCKLCGIIVDVARELTNLMSVLPSRKGASEIIRIMHTLEYMGDDTFHQSMAELFSEQNSPIYIIKFKEIYELLEETIDTIYFVGKLIRGIIIKLG